MTQAIAETESVQYPGGKSGAGIWQRLINLIPRHRILVSAFAGRCGVTRRIRPAEHTIVIDRDADVCQWWDDWRRSPKGRNLEVHHCDSIEWLRHFTGLTEYSAVKACDAVPGDASSRGSGSRIRRPVMGVSCDRMSPIAAASAGDAPGSDADAIDAAATPESAAEYFIFCDPPYVMSTRSGPLYQCEMDDADHLRLLEVLTRAPRARYRWMLCGYPSPLYASLQGYRSIDHRVPTRRGLKDERVWMNYRETELLHDYRHLGRCRRSRERIRRRQINWLKQLEIMPVAERLAMLQAIKTEFGGCV